ncbi:MAG: pentapeptide repeat-containing protein [Pseudooceanicola sp.]
MDTYLTIVTHPLLWVFLGLTLVFYLIQWLIGLDTAQSSSDPLGWAKRKYVTIILSAAIFLALGALTFYLVEIGLSVRDLVDLLRSTAAQAGAQAEPGDDFANLRNIAYAVAVLIGVLAASATVFFSVIKVWINERTATATERATTATEQGLITDRITKAVAGLGAEKTVKQDGEDRTEPNIEVRIGAIFALERVSQDSERDHIQIMEILCAYIRENAGAGAPDLPERELDPQQWSDWGRENRRHPRLDVDVAFKVIERRSPERKAKEANAKYRLGLERAPLTGLILANRDLTDAYLTGARLQGADLNGAQLRGANFHRAALLGANLVEAELQGADLGRADLQVANLRLAKMQGVAFWLAHSNEFTTLHNAGLFGASLRGVDLTHLPEFKDHLTSVFADGSVIVPAGATRPPHWATEKLTEDDFTKAWRAWLDEIGFDPNDPDTW